MLWTAAYVRLIIPVRPVSAVRIIITSADPGCAKVVRTTR